MILLQFDKRLVSIGNIQSPEEIYKTLSISLESIEKYQTSFSGRGGHENHVKTSKYHWLTFIPVNILEQFRKLVNVYFLSLIILVSATNGPVDPKSWGISLAFIVFLTMIKQAYEDYQRHNVDEKNNKREVTVLRKGSLTKIECQDIQVGEIIYLTENDIVPTDAVILSTSNTAGLCYVMTANLNGETSLKTKQTAKATSKLGKPKDAKRKLSSMVAHIECENPNPKLDQFMGKLSICPSESDLQPIIRGTDGCSLTAENLILAGTQIRNTRDLLCVCVYAGQETKVCLNSQICKNKFSSIERTYNKYIILFVFILLIQVVSWTLLSMYKSVYWKHANSDSSNSNHYWYLCNEEKSAGSTDWMLQVLSWLALLQIIPISLYVVLEVQKVILR